MDTSVKLEVIGLTKHFGGVTAVKDSTWTAEPGTLTTILGPNGAGKTTLFNLITSILPPSSGQVLVDGTDITNWKTHRVSRLGIARTFQKLRLFRDLTAVDNVVVSALSVGEVGWLKSLIGSPAYKQENHDARELAVELLDLVGLGGKGQMLAGDMPHGEQRLLEIARALALRPKLLLLDEPMAGLNAQESRSVAKVAGDLRDRGITVVMIEHHVDVALSVSDHAVVVDFGAKIFDGSPDAARRDPAVLKAYLGADAQEVL
jgi:ABC-type branched-subunit amino acid transport system ATPase component